MAFAGRASTLPGAARGAPPSPSGASESSVSTVDLEELLASLGVIEEDQDSERPSETIEGSRNWCTPPEEASWASLSSSAPFMTPVSGGRPSPDGGALDTSTPGTLGTSWAPVAEWEPPAGWEPPAASPSPAATLPAAITPPPVASPTPTTVTPSGSSPASASEFFSPQSFAGTPPYPASPTEPPSPTGVGPSRATDEGVVGPEAPGARVKSPEGSLGGRSTLWAPPEAPIDLVDCPSDNESLAAATPAISPSSPAGSPTADSPSAPPVGLPPGQGTVDPSGSAGVRGRARPTTPPPAPESDLDDSGDECLRPPASIAPSTGRRRWIIASDSEDSPISEMRRRPGLDSPRRAVGGARSLPSSPASSPSPSPSPAPSPSPRSSSPSPASSRDSPAESGSASSTESAPGSSDASSSAESEPSSTDASSSDEFMPSEAPSSEAGDSPLLPRARTPRRVVSVPPKPPPPRRPLATPSRAPPNPARRPLTAPRPLPPPPRGAAVGGRDAPPHAGRRPPPSSPAPRAWSLPRGSPTATPATSRTVWWLEEAAGAPSAGRGGTRGSPGDGEPWSIAAVSPRSGVVRGEPRGEARGRPREARGSLGGTAAAPAQTPEPRRPLAPAAPPATIPTTRPPSKAPIQTPSAAASAFARRREQLTAETFEELNRLAFDGLIPRDLEITWNKRLATTAGLTHYSRERRGGAGRGGAAPAPPGALAVSAPGDAASDAPDAPGAPAPAPGAPAPASGSGTERRARVELSTKVVDTESKLRSTLAHELCHVATWLFDGVAKPPHGSAWKAWAKRAARQVPDIDVTTCHAYEIFAPFRWRCTNATCGVEIGRHSNSIDVDRKVCGRCRSKLAFLGRVNRDGVPAKVRAPTAFSSFVKERFASEKAAVPPGTPHGEIMRRLSAKWAVQKGTAGDGGAGRAAAAALATPAAAQPASGARPQSLLACFEAMGIGTDRGAEA